MPFMKTIFAAALAASSTSALATLAHNDSALVPEQPMNLSQLALEADLEADLECEAGLECEADLECGADLECEAEWRKKCNCHKKKHKGPIFASCTTENFETCKSGVGHKGHSNRCIDEFKVELWQKHPYSDHISAHVEGKGLSRVEHFI